MKAIAACDMNFAIGNNGKLLCYIPGDLKYFKEKTIGKTIVMGRKTLESLPGGKPLPNRNTIVVSSTIQESDDYIVARKIEEVIELCKDMDTFVCGGATIYQQLLPYCDEVYITYIYDEFEADAFFPELTDDFKITWQSEKYKENEHTYTFIQYKRID